MSRVIDSYKLSPMQAGMLFHAVSGEEPGVDVEQVIATLREPFDEAQFLRAWERVVERHPILRTRFRWQQVPEPVQEVLDGVRIPVERFDWRALPVAECAERFQALLERERVRSLDLGEAPVMRLTLVRILDSEHRVLWTFHHALLDGRSFPLVLREVFAFYEAFLRGAEAELPLPRPYRDYIEWLGKLDHESSKSYWQNLLLGFREPTPLVRTHGRKAHEVQGAVRGIRELRLSGVLTTALTERARDAAVTLGTLLQGAWSLLLHQYSSRSDIVFGGTRACRKSTVPGAVEMVGLFINTLPIRVRIDPEAQLVPWLQQLRAQQMALRAYEHTPLAKVQGWSEVPRGKGLFETLVVFEHQTLDAQLRASGGAWTARSFQYRGQTNYPLTLAAYGGAELLLQLDYSRQCFDDDAVARMLAHLRTLLERMAARPPGTLKNLLLPAEAERPDGALHSLRANPTAITHAEYAHDKRLDQLVEAQAAEHPQAIGVVHEQDRLSYGELNARADRIANHLRTLGVKPDAVVALFVERSVEMVVGILGILKAGGAYLPIDPSDPEERIAFVLADANAARLLTQRSLSPRLPPGSAQHVFLDSFDWNDPQARASDDAGCHPGNLAYVIYTSGSTGSPKGVCIEHPNIVNYVLGIAERLQLKPGMHHALVSTIAADLGNTVIFPALATGGCLHVISQERAQNQALLSAYFGRENIDVLKIVPSHLAALQTGSNPEKVMPKSRLILGGESSRLAWIERLRNLSPDCQIFNHYGPTETTVGVLTYPVGAHLPNTQSGTLPLGEPLPNTRVYILDGAGQPVPAGDQGELCIGGRGVARGYLNRPDLTAEKFVPDPFGPDPGGRLYRTGDLARYLPDGNYEFCGRIDDQVKLHGHRVELGEIEAALRAQRGVRDAVVLAREDNSGGKHLVAYLVPQRAHQPLWEGKALYLLPDGSPVAHLNKNETAYIYHEIFVLQAYLRHGITIQDGDCIVDAGANIGLFTVFASRLARNLRIISLEPNPAAFECLKANAEAWGTSVKCLPFGLSREAKSAELTFFEGLSLLSGFYADAAKEREVVKSYVFNQQSEALNREQLATGIDEMLDDRLQAKTVSAELRTLSSVIAQEGIERIDLLKINVEKSELDVLLGLNPDDWPKIRQLVIEVDLRQNLEPITSLLERQGFAVLVEQDPLLRNTELYYAYAIRPSAAGPRLIQHQAADAHVRSLSPADEEILTPTSLRRALKRRLPQYMIPSAFVLMEKFPLTPNGKLDRKALAPPAASTVVDASFVAPQTPNERILADIWSQVLRVEHVGVRASFFDLGGDSILSMQVIAKANEAGLPITVKQIFQYQTIAELALVAEKLWWLEKSKARSDGDGDREEIEF